MSTATTTDRIPVTCPECGAERHLLPSMVRRIVKGYAANRCRPCGHRHRRAAPTPEPPADTWRAAAACLGADLGLFFGYGRDAIEICAGCQVRQQCLTEELSRGLADQWGIRGGTTPTERRTMLRRAAREVGV